MWPSNVKQQTKNNNKYNTYLPNIHAHAHTHASSFTHTHTHVKYI